MSANEMSEPKNPRLNQVVDDLLATLRAFIRKHHVTHDEYRQAVALMVETGTKGEIPLMLDVFLESTVDQVDSAERPGTESSVEGPFYLADAPLMKSPCILPHRVDEPGEVLEFSGTVRSLDGKPLGGAILDFWQADAEGAYSHFNLSEAAAPNNLRARVQADESGRFEVQTWVPAPYQIPKDGPTGALLKEMGRHAWRPAHLHVRLTHAECVPLTTQIFFQGDPWIDSDVVGAVKQSLIVNLVRHTDPAEIRQRGYTQPFCTISYDFVLPKRFAKAA